MCFAHRFAKSCGAVCKIIFLNVAVLSAVSWLVFEFNIAQFGRYLRTVPCAKVTRTIGADCNTRFCRYNGMTCKNSLPLRSGNRGDAELPPMLKIK